MLTSWNLNQNFKKIKFKTSLKKYVRMETCAQFTIYTNKSLYFTGFINITTLIQETFA